MEETLFRLLTEHVYTILFIGLILEFVALPIPGETMMVLAGVMGYHGHANYWLMVISGALGTIIGMQISFEVGRRLGVRAIDKYGAYIGLTKTRMDAASKYFNKYGNVVIFIAYYLPGVRHILGYFSGISKMDARKFHLYSTIGGIFWVFTFITLGYIVGPSWKKIFHLMHQYGLILLILGIAGLLIYLIFKKLGKKEFLQELKLTSRILLPILIIIAAVDVYLLTSMRNPKDTDDIFLVTSIILLVISIFLFLKYNNKNKTSEKLLVVVDFQKDFVDGGALAVENSARLEKIIKAKIEEYQTNKQDVIYTLDTHEENYLQTREGKFLPIEHCIKGTDGHKLYGSVADNLGDAKRVFEKDTFGSLDLAKFIEKSEYKEIEFVGLVSNICVLSNIVLVQTFNKKVSIKVAAEAVLSNNESVNSNIKEYFEALGVEVI